jgi:vacuolar-type H+-ATPase subunit C/Vma6
MRSRLLKPADYDNLLARPNAEELISALSDSPYQPDIETALVLVGAERCVFEAVRLNFSRTLRQIQQFYADEARELIGLPLRRWDRDNLLAILRGQSHEIAAKTVLTSVIPVGQIDEIALRELARQPGLQAAIDLMTVWQLPYARPLRTVKARVGATSDLDQLELALNRFHYRSLLKALAGGNKDRRLVRETVQTEIDLLNLRTTLRLVNIPGAEALVKQRYSAASVAPLLVPGGKLPLAPLIALVAEAGGLEAVVQGLGDSRFGAALQSGWQRYRAPGGSYSMLERELERWQAQAAAAFFARDPLSIAIPIGFLACKETEIANLRLVSQAATLGLNRDNIKQELILV